MHTQPAHQIGQPLVSRHVKRFGSAVALLVLGMLLSACSTATLAEQIALIAPEDAVSAGAVPTDVTSNRLLVLGNNGNIYTLVPDGDNRIAITRDAGPRIQYLQPTWSPDGEQIAYTSVRREESATTTILATKRSDGSDGAMIEVPFAPFYIHWSPDSARIAYLSNWNRGENLPSMALRLVETGTAEDGAPTLKAKTLAEGQPFYFSWAPSGDQLLTHIGNERLELQSIDGAQEALYMSTGAFPAPIWSRNGEQLIFALSEEGGAQRLVVADAAGEPMSDITDFSDRISFTLSPDSAQLAYVITESAAGGAAFGPLYLFDVNTQATREISANPVLAFFWSPDSTKLAFMEVERADSNIRLRWKVWNGKEITTYGAFLPSNHFYRNYLTFFDQYVQSMTIWSPDSLAFTYSGIGPTGVRGIWVQKLEDAGPTLVSSGIYAAWSPK